MGSLVHTCSKLWTKICKIRQNFKGDLTKFCEIFFFFSCKGLRKPQQCVIYVYFFINSVVKWSENSVRFEFFMGITFKMGQIL